MTALAHRLQELVEDLVQELLTFHIPQTTTTVVVFQLVEVLVFWQELRKVLILRESVEIGEDSVTLYMTGVVEVDMLRVGIHRAYLLPNGISIIREINTVAE